MDMSTKTEKVNLYMASDTASMLEAAAIKLRCSKSAVVEALIRIECGLSADDPVALWFKHHGMKPTQTDYSKLTESDLAAKRPRGARVSGKPKGNHQAGVAAGTSSSSHEGKGIRKKSAA